jgi:hypothetical protein
MICINETMRRHALALGFRFVLWDRFTGVPVKLLLLIALLESVLVDSRVGWIKPYLPLWMRLQISEDTKRLFKMPGSGHREVARQQQCLQKDIKYNQSQLPTGVGRLVPGSVVRRRLSALSSLPAMEHNCKRKV